MQAAWNRCDVEEHALLAGVEYGQFVAVEQPLGERRCVDRPRPGGVHQQSRPGRASRTPLMRENGFQRRSVVW